MFAHTGDSLTNFTDPSGELFFLIPMAIGHVSKAAFSIGRELFGAKLSGQQAGRGRDAH